MNLDADAKEYRTLDLELDVDPSTATPQLRIVRPDLTVSGWIPMEWVETATVNPSGTYSASAQVLLAGPGVVDPGDATVLPLGQSVAKWRITGLGDEVIARRWEIINVA
jgi:hypothetical protein